MFVGSFRDRSVAAWPVLALAAAVSVVIFLGLMSSPARPQGVNVDACPVESTVESIRKVLVPNVVYGAAQSALIVEAISQRVGRQVYQFDVTEIVVYADPDRLTHYEVGFAHQGCVLDVKIIHRRTWDELITTALPNA